MDHNSSRLSHPLLLALDLLTLPTIPTSRLLASQINVVAMEGEVQNKTMVHAKVAVTSFLRT